jgi:hypothetical protein
MHNDKCIMMNAMQYEEWIMINVLWYFFNDECIMMNELWWMHYYNEWIMMNVLWWICFMMP